MVGPVTGNAYITGIRGARVLTHLELLVRGERGGILDTEMEVRLFVALVTAVGKPASTAHDKQQNEQKHKGFDSETTSVGHQKYMLLIYVCYQLV